MSDKKAKILVIVSAIILILAGFTLYKVFELQGYGTNKSGGYINYNIDDYVEINPVIFNNYNDFYESVNISKININNLDSKISEEFIVKQNEIINYIDGYYKEFNIRNGYLPVNNVSSNIKKQINGTILSVFYEIKFNLDEYIFDDNIKSYIITLNIDLGTERALTTQDLLSKYDYTKEYISKKLFEEDVLIEESEVVIDKNTNISLTKADIERKKEYYIDRIVNEFDNIIKVYIENKSLVLVYDKRELNELFFDNKFNEDIEFRYLK